MGLLEELDRAEAPDPRVLAARLEDALAWWPDHFDGNARDAVGQIRYILGSIAGDE